MSVTEISPLLHRKNKGVLLIAIMMVVPIIFMALVMVMSSTMRSSSHSGVLKRDLELQYMAESAGQIAYNIFGSNNYVGFTHFADGEEVVEDDPFYGLVIHPSYGFERDADGWYRWEADDDSPSFFGTNESEFMRFSVHSLVATPGRVNTGSFFNATSAQQASWRILVEVGVGNRRMFGSLEGDTVAPGEYTVFDNGSNSDFSRTTFQNVTGKIHANGDLYLAPWQTPGYERTVDLFEIFKTVDREGLDRVSLGLYIKNTLKPAMHDAFIELYSKNAADLIQIYEPDIIDFLSGENPTLSMTFVQKSEVPKLQINLDRDDASITAGGSIIRRKDLWGRTTGEGTRVAIANDNESFLLNGLEQGEDPDDPSAAYDSLNPDWYDADRGALKKWKGKVADHAAGQKEMRLPPVEAFLPEGYYDKKADFSISEQTDVDSYDWLSKKTFYNQAEEREVTVYEVDVEQYTQSSHFGSLLYSSEPIRLVNGASLPSEFSVACADSVYIQGDFNESQLPDQTDVSANMKPASIMTTDRVWTLTSDFDDEQSYNFGGLIGRGKLENMRDKDSTVAEFAKGYNIPIDDDGILEINASIVDGILNDDTEEWAKGSDTGVNHPRYDENLDIIVPGGKMVLPGVGVPDPLYPTDEGFLQNMSLMKVKINGSRIHMRNSVMGEVGGAGEVLDSNLPGISQYRKRSYYIPMRPGTEDDPGFTFLHDPTVTGTAEDMDNPLFFIRAGRRLRWQSSKNVASLTSQD